MKRLFRSRPFRILAALLVLPLWQAIEIISDNDLHAYTQTGDAILLAVWCLFALGAWWYAEDRDRRRAAGGTLGDGPQPVNGDGN